mgnify:CR=1 FL=1
MLRVNHRTDPSSFSTNSDNRSVEVGHDVDRVLVTQERVNSPTIGRARPRFCCGKRANRVCPHTGRYRSLLMTRIRDSQSITVIFHSHVKFWLVTVQSMARHFNLIRWDDFKVRAGARVQNVYCCIHRSKLRRVPLTNDC